MSDDTPSGDPLPPGQRPDPPPPRIPDHEVLRCIGEGSYGQVWLARNLMGEWRAVKVVSRHKFTGDEHLYERELNGIRRYEPISRSHESLVQVLHVGRDDAAGHFYYVMELADDANAERRAPNAEIDQSLVTSAATYQPRTLRSELKRQPRLPARECVQVGVALATALEQLHKNKLVHRDIKPSNIIFVNGRAKLADIGLVTGLDAARSFVGTLGYVAPEGPGQPPADIYALGMVLYEMSTGRDRFDFAGLPNLGDLSESERQGVCELNAVFLKACASERAERHKSAGELRDELLRLEVGVSIERQRALERAYVRLKVASCWVGAVLLVGALTFGAWFYRGRSAFREALLAQARLERKGERVGGWFTNNWALIQQAAAIRSAPDVLEQAASALAGLDAKPLCFYLDAAGGSAAFARDGTVLVGGALGSPALLINTNGTKSELPVRSEGPVCWTDEGVALQFSVGSNACLLQEVVTGHVHRLFPLADGENVNRVVGPVVAMSVDGSRVAAAVSRDEQGRVVVWDAVTGESLGEAPISATALTFSTDGALLAAGDKDGNIVVHSMPGLARVLVLPPATRPIPVRCLALNRDRVVRYGSASKTNSWLLAASYKGGEVAIWDLSTQQIRAFCRGLVFSVASLAFHPDGLTLAGAGRHEVRLWDVMKGETLLRITGGGNDDGRALAFSEDGTRMVWGTEHEAGQSAVGVWELNSHRGVRALRGLTASARWIWFSHDSQLLAAVSDNWRVAIWESGSGRLVNLFEVPMGGFPDSAAGAFDASCLRFAFAAGSEARLYELGTGRMLKHWSLPKSGLMDHLQFHADGRLLFVRRGPDTESPNERRWRVYELPVGGTPRLLHEQTETNWVPYGTAFATGGERFFVWTYDRVGQPPVLRGYDVANGQELWRVAIDERVEPIVRLGSTGRWFAYKVDRAERYRVVRLSDFKEFDLSPEHCEAISPSGDEFAIRVPRGYFVRSRAGPAADLPLVSDWTPCFEPSFSPDGKLLAWGTLEGVVLVAEIETVRQRLNSLNSARR